jgi:ABC-type dipeptide/oligopeptide/nickel transport system ATPase component
VLKSGELVEAGNAETFFAHPSADYSQHLLAETPSLDLVAAP